MSKSFLVDLSAYTLYRPIGDDGKTVQRKMMASDLFSILLDLGYTTIEPKFGYVSTWGIDLSDLRGTIAELSLGISANTPVNMKLVGRTTDKVLVTLRY